MIPDPDGELDLTDDQVAVLCDRRFGIGADGILRVVRVRGDRRGRGCRGQPEPSGSWTTATPTARRPRCAATASACSPATSPTRAGPRSMTARSLIGTRAGVKTVTRSDLGFEVDLGPWRVEHDETSSCVRADSACRARARHRRRQPARRRRAAPTPRSSTALELTVAPAAASRAAARREHRVRRAERPAGARRRRLDPHARVRARRGRDPELRHRASRPRRWRCGTGPGPARPTTGRSRCRAARWACGCCECGGDLHVLLSGPATLVYSGEVALA